MEKLDNIYNTITYLTTTMLEINTKSKTLTIKE